MKSETERLFGQQSVWVDNIHKGLGVFTRTWGHVATGGEFASIMMAEILQQGKAAWGTTSAGHKIWMRLHGNILVVQHRQADCDACMAGTKT